MEDGCFQREKQATETNAKKAFVHNNWVKLGTVGYFMSDIRCGRHCSAWTMYIASTVSICICIYYICVNMVYRLFILFLQTIVDVLHHFYINSMIIICGPKVQSRPRLNRLCLLVG